MSSATYLSSIAVCGKNLLPSSDSLLSGDSTLRPLIFTSTDGVLTCLTSGLFDFKAMEPSDSADDVVIRVGFCLVTRVGCKRLSSFFGSFVYKVGLLFLLKPAGPFTMPF